MQRYIDTKIQGTIFRNIYILESREWWTLVQDGYDPAQDLVLTYDFALKREVESIGGVAGYVDHLCDQSLMHANNFLAYKFFRDWHHDNNGADIFHYRQVPFGFSFRIEIWNDFTFYIRNRLCIEQLSLTKYTTLLVGTEQQVVEEILHDMQRSFVKIKRHAGIPKSAYYFPIHQWIDERLRGRGMRRLLRDTAITLQGLVMSWLDRLTECVRPRVRIFVQEYYPTRELLQCLKQWHGVRVIQGHFSAARGGKKFLQERPIPVYGSLQAYVTTASQLLDSFRRLRANRLVLSTGIDVTDAVYRVLERRITSVLPETIRALHCVIRYLDRHPIKLEILIANVGQIAMLVDCVAKSRGVPSYLIINGLMGNEYLDEAKYASVINGYSTSIRDHYFRGMKNIVCLGDPRMDSYALSKKRLINREAPVITIGASGFNNIDLNSFLAVEFEYLYDVLSAVGSYRREGQVRSVVLKARSNGYVASYQKFVDEYFPGVVDRIVDVLPLKEVLERTDLLISLHSQALFEASCLGIPCIYHKNDCEILDPPFNGRSELVTTTDEPELKQAISDFLRGSARYEPFLQRGVMEKYIGPLDGNNLERNLRHVAEMLRQVQVVQ